MQDEKQEQFYPFWENASERDLSKWVHKYSVAHLGQISKQYKKNSHVYLSKHSHIFRHPDNDQYPSIGLQSGRNRLQS